MSKISELPFLERWISYTDPKAAEAEQSNKIALTEVKLFAVALTSEGTSDITYAQGLQVVAAGWGYNSYEFMQKSAEEGLVAPYRAFSLSSTISAARRLKSPTERQTAAKPRNSNGIIANRTYILKVLGIVSDLVGTLDGAEDIDYATMHVFDSNPRSVDAPAPNHDLMKHRSYNPLARNPFREVVQKCDSSTPMAKVAALPADGVFAVEYSETVNSEQFRTEIFVLMRSGQIHTLSTSEERHEDIKFATLASGRFTHKIENI